MAIGVEKVKDTGYQGLNAFPIPTDGTDRTLTAAAMFTLVVPAYAEKYGVDDDELRAGAGPHRLEEPLQRRPQPAGAVPQGDDASRPICSRAAVAGRLGVFDCAGVADGARRRDRGAGRGRARVHRQAALRQGAVVRRRQRLRPHRPRLRLHDASPRSSAAPQTPTPRPASPIPAHEIAMAEVHDCFTPTELVLMEDLGFSERGTAWKEVAGRHASTSTATCRSTPTAASRASATRSARRACA